MTRSLIHAWPLTGTKLVAHARSCLTSPPSLVQHGNDRSSCANEGACRRRLTARRSAQSGLAPFAGKSVGAWSAIAAATLGPPAVGARLVISDVHVLSMNAERAMGEQGSGASGIPEIGDGVRTVVVDQGRIVEIAARPGLELYRRGDVLLRGDGLWLLPGLIDSAVATIDPADLRLLALAGVTSVVVESSSAKTWLDPLVAITDARLPSIYAAESMPDGEAPRADPAVGSELARIDAAGRWISAGRSEQDLAMLDPGTAARWRASLSEQPRPELPSSACLARREQLRQTPWVVASSCGEPFMPPQSATVDEMVALQDAGFDPTRILRAATSAAADRLGRGDLGRLRPGAVADLLLLEADPRVDLSALRRVRAVVLRGELLRAAELESTRDLLVELRGEQAAILQAPLAPSESGAFAGRWLIRFDGLPRGVRTSSAVKTRDGWLCIDRTEMWSPLHSVLEVSSFRDHDGATRRLELRYNSPGDELAATLVREARAWNVAIRRDGSDSQWTLADPDSDSDSDPDPGHGHEPEPRPDADRPVGATLLYEMWPSTLDLRLIGAQAPTAFPLPEFVFGTGAPGWARRRLVALPASAANGQLAMLARSLHAAPWAAAESPRDGTHAAGTTGPAGIGQPGTNEPGTELGAGPKELGPKGMRQIGMGQQAVAVIAIGEPLEPPGWVQRFLRGIEPRVHVAGAFAVDRDGWPVVGRFAVPEGMWEFHPLAGITTRP